MECGEIRTQTPTLSTKYRNKWASMGSSKGQGALGLRTGGDSCFRRVESYNAALSAPPSPPSPPLDWVVGGSMRCE